MNQLRATEAELLTHPGRAAVATLCVTGPDAARIVDDIFHTATGLTVRAAAVGRVLYGRVGSGIGEDVVACRTLMDCVEIHCHGGEAAAQRILANLISSGAVRRNPLHAEGQSRPNLQSEAWDALTHATTERTAAILLDQAHGALARELELLRRKLQNGSHEALSLLQNLCEAATLGQRLTSHFVVVITGPPNVGKSSLLNALLGIERAIVHNQPGTTRDLVTATTAIDGWPVQFVDTAGLRETEDRLELAGTALARQSAAQADLVLEVRDAQAWQNGSGGQPWQFPSSLRVINKSDLLAESNLPAAGECVFTSATMGAGLDHLKEAISRKLVSNPPLPGAAVPFSERVIGVLHHALEWLKQGDTVAAMQAVHQLLTGRQ